MEILISVLAVVGGVSGVVSAFKFVAGKTSNKTDDKVAEVLEALAPLIKEFLLSKGVETAKRSETPVPTREQHRDHR